jgi:hypothetical protein
MSRMPRQPPPCRRRQLGRCQGAPARHRGHTRSLTCGDSSAVRAQCAQQ